MNATCADLLLVLLRTTLALTVAVGAVQLLLTLARCQSPRVHRFAWCAALAQGLLFAQVPCSIGWTPWSANSPAAESPPVLPPMFEGGGMPVGLLSVVAGKPAPAQPEVELAAVEAPRWTLAELARQWWAVALVAAWLTGMLIVMGRGARRYVRFARHLTNAQACPLTWREEFDREMAMIQPRPAIALQVSDKVGPLLCRRWRGYVLIVPAPLWQALSPDQRIAILRHEIAHHQRGDLWSSLAVRAMALAHWFNPCAWWAVRRFDEAGEWACDQRAASDQAAAGDFARLLVRICEGCRPAGMLTSSACGSSLTRRVRRLISQTKEDSAMKAILLCTLAGAMLMAGLLRVQFVGAADTEKSDGKPSKQAQAMVRAAKDAYDAMAAAYAAETVAFNNLYIWSRNWLQAELNAAENAEQRIAAYRGHLERMSAQFLKIAALYTIGAHGGEAEKYNAMLYHIGEAKAMLGKEDQRANEIVTLKLTKNGDVSGEGFLFSVHGNLGDVPNAPLPKAQAREFGRGLPKPNSADVLSLLENNAAILGDLGYDPKQIEVMLQADRAASATQAQKLIEVCKAAGFVKISLRAAGSDEKRKGN